MRRSKSSEASSGLDDGSSLTALLLNFLCTARFLSLPDLSASGIKALAGDW